MFHLTCLKLIGVTGIISSDNTPRQTPWQKNQRPPSFDLVYHISIISHYTSV